MPKSLHDHIETGDRYADAFEAFDPGNDPGLDGPSPELKVKLAAVERGRVEREILGAVIEARRASLSWLKIGQVLGTSGEAARQRYAASVPQD